MPDSVIPTESSRKCAPRLGRKVLGFSCLALLAALTATFYEMEVASASSALNSVSQVRVSAVDIKGAPLENVEVVVIGRGINTPGAPISRTPKATGTGGIAQIRVPVAGIYLVVGVYKEEMVAQQIRVAPGDVEKVTLTFDGVSKAGDVKTPGDINVTAASGGSAVSATATAYNGAGLPVSSTNVTPASLRVPGPNSYLVVGHYNGLYDDEYVFLDSGGEVDANLQF